MMFRITQILFVAIVLGQLSCSSPDVPKGVIPKLKEDKVLVATGLETFNPKVDILFVIDDSGSMGSHQDNLAQNMNKFIANFFGQLQIDFHIGVITTSDDTTSSGAVCCGELIGVPKFVDKKTPNYQALLRERMVVGTAGSATEKVFDPVRKALSSPLTSGANKGFLRQGAYLAVVLITDAEDQSVVSNPNELFTYLTAVAGKTSKLLTYGVIVPSGLTDCPRDGGDTSSPARVESFLSMSVNAGKNSFSLCAPDFGDQLSSMGKDLAKRVGNVMYLDRIPVAETIVVKYGTQTVPADPQLGWSYDIEQNAIVFGPGLEWSEQAQGTQISVQYDSTEFKD